MPDWKALVRARVAPLSGLDPTRETDIVDELAQHVAEHYAELVAAGLSEGDAVEQALSPLDDPARVAAASVPFAARFSPFPTRAGLWTLRARWPISAWS